MIDSELALKHRDVLECLGALDGVVVAFSGGVDSTLLLRLAKDALNHRCVALTAVSPSLAMREKQDAENLAREIGVRHLQVDSHELDREGFATNPANRCYFCKTELFDHCFAASRELNLPTVVYGATADDVGDHRPGMKAARERGARAPLLEAGLGKEDVRNLSRFLGLSTWDKPAMACLSSRFPYGTQISAERLARIEQAEEVLRREGFREVRVRYHDSIARIEVGAEEWDRILVPELRHRISSLIRAAGFRYVVLDLESFRSGRLNEELIEPETPARS
jgi:uncharacterized protein